MKINLVTRANEHMASYRFRVDHLYEVLKSLGHSVSIKRFNDNEADINWFSKHIDANEILEMMKNTKGYKIFDVCDYHLDSNELGDFYKQALSIADGVSTTTQYFKDTLESNGYRLPIVGKVHVFSDPINTLEGFYEPKNPLKTIWFGHSTNLKAASGMIDKAVSFGQVTCFSNAKIVGDKDIISKQFELGWLEENLRDFDLVLLPQDQDCNFKSPNRFVDALNAGCAVLFTNEFLYEDLKDYGYKVKEDLSDFEEVVKRIQSGKEEVKERIKKGKEAIKENFSFEAIQAQVKTIIETVCKEKE